MAQKGGRDGAVSEKSLKMSRFSVLFSEHGRGLDISGCPEVVGMKKSSKNCHQRNRWEYTGPIREGKTEIPDENGFQPMATSST